MNRAFFILSLIAIMACENPPKTESQNPFKGMTGKEKQAALENALTRASRKEEIQIQGYLKRHQIPAKKTATGIHYFVYQSGEGEAILDGQNVVVDYVVTKINGDTLYQTTKDFELFNVSNSDKESGLHEAIKLLKLGAKAIIILPSHRAHGISGDSDKIPPLTTVIYNISVKSVVK